MKLTPDRLRELVFMSLGEASMCWSETPGGTFDDIHASRIGERLMSAIEAYFQTLDHLTTTTIIRDGQGHEIAHSKGLWRALDASE
jgi:hypothetical protein